MNELFKKIKNERMTPEEKQVGINQLQAFINANPVTSPWYTKFGNKIVSPFTDGIMMHHKMLASAFVLIILVSATGGTSIAARNSIPGDVLYPVKINLNEKVETFTALSPEAKATVEAKHVDERLTEAEQLTEQDKFNNGLKTQVETQFSQDLQNAMIHVNTLNSKGDSKSAKRVKASVENSLQKHKVVVEEILNNKNSRLKKVTSKATLINPESPTINTMRVSTFSATVAATSTKETVDLQTESHTATQIETDDELENERTPLLDETLERIFNSREGKDD